MGFYTTFSFYRPGPFPAVTCGDLVRLQAGLVSAGVVPSTRPACRVKFGHIHADDKPLDEWVGGLVRTRKSSRCDIDIQGHVPTTEPIVLDTLTKHAAETVYRAELHIGSLPEDSCRRLHVPDPRNDQAVTLCDVGFSIGPVELSAADVSEAYLVSLMSLSISGSGYCYPRSPREVLAAMRSEPAILAAERVVESIWPVQPVPPGDDDIEERRDMGDLWMHDLDRPHGWAWGCAY